MTIAQWQPGTLYLPGAVVSRTTSTGITRPPIVNPSFELGDTGWDKSLQFTIVNDPGNGYDGDWYSQFVGSVIIPAGSISGTDAIEVTPGNTIVMKAVCDIGADPDAQAYLQLNFYSDSGITFISSAKGARLLSGSDGDWQNIQISTVVPEGAVSVRVVATALTEAGTVKFDNFSWDLASSNASNSLLFKAVQSEYGISGETEPVWPTVNGGTVVDNTITWEAFLSATVTWEARPILKSGETEPVWPTTSGALVLDGTISWKTAPLWIEDENCPHTKEVAIGASKIFAGDNDITRFSATLNPRDWTTTEDAGFLPTGMHQGAQVGVSALGVYRGNLAVWSKSSFQVWQIDPDPVAMALLDAMEGIGSRHHKAVQPVSNDLFFLSSLGVRTVGVAAGSTNLATGDAGIPIDTLVQVEVTDEVDPIATYYPSMGQYWLAFPPFIPSEPGEPPVDPPVDPPPETGICGDTSMLEQGHLLGPTPLTLVGGLSGIISEGSTFEKGISLEDTKVFSFTAAIVRAGPPEVGYKVGVFEYQYNGANPYFSFYIDENGYMNIYAQNAAKETILEVQITNNGGSFATSSIHMFGVVIDLSDNLKREIWINNQNIGENPAWVTWTTYTDDFIKLSDTGSDGEWLFGMGYGLGWGASGANGGSVGESGDTDCLGFISVDDDCTLVPAGIWDSEGWVMDPQRWEGWYILQPAIFFGHSFWRNSGWVEPLYYDANDLEKSWEVYLGEDYYPVLLNEVQPVDGAVINFGIGGKTVAT